MILRSKLSSALALLLAAGGGIVAGILVTRHREALAPAAAADAGWFCPMHPDYVSDTPGDCPVCSMRLVPRETSAPGPSASGPTGPGITLTADRLQAGGVRTSPVQRLRATAIVRARGRVAPDETRIVHVHSRVSGYVEDVRASFVGAPVKRGETLFTILSPELIASQQELLSARRAADALASSSYEWAQRDQLALVDAARQRLALLGMSARDIERVERTGEVRRTVAVTSPVDGVVTAREAFAHGRAITPDLDVYTIADLSVAWILAQVYERDLPHVSVGQEAEVTAEGAPPLRGRVAFVAPFVDPQTRTVSVRIEAPNESGALRTDALADVELRQDLGPQLVVPDGAILDTGATSHAFVATGGGRIEPRAIVAGPPAREGRVVLDGLAEGEQVVTSAQFLVDSESQLQGAIASWGERAQPPSDAAPALSARITTDPSPPRTGRASVTVELADASGPVEGAEVELSLGMPAMGSMAPLRSSARLAAQGGGRYAGTIEILAPFAWNATVTATRDGRVVGVAHATVESR